MRIVVVLNGLDTVRLEGRPREVLKRADEIVTRWKVVWDGKKES